MGKASQYWTWRRSPVPSPAWWPSRWSVPRPVPTPGAADEKGGKTKRFRFHRSRARHRQHAADNDTESGKFKSNVYQATKEAKTDTEAEYGSASPDNGLGHQVTKTDTDNKYSSSSPTMGLDAKE